MFETRKLRKEQELIKKLEMIRPTSKSDWKRECLYLCNLDVEKAEKMYDFLVKDMSEIPEIAPAQKTFMENMGEQANGVFSCLRDNQDMLSKGAEFIKGIIQKKPVAPPEPLPTINP